jgi:hypothetical protein
MLDPAGFNGRSQYDDIEKVPDLIIVSISNELAWAVDEDIEENKRACEQFLIKANQLNKSVLLVFPERLSPFVTAKELKMHDFWRNVDLDQIDVPMTQGQQDHYHFSRHSLSELAKQIDNWIIKKI